MTFVATVSPATAPATAPAIAPAAAIIVDLSGVNVTLANHTLDEVEAETRALRALRGRLATIAAATRPAGRRTVAARMAALRTVARASVDVYSHDTVASFEEVTYQVGLEAGGWAAYEAETVWVRDWSDTFRPDRQYWNWEATGLPSREAAVQAAERRAAARR